MFFLQSSGIAYVDYVPPRFSDGKEAFIYYYVKDPGTGKLRRIRMKVNRIPAKERLKKVRAIMADLSTKLSLGWNPLLTAKAPKAFHTLFDALDQYLIIKGKECEENSMRSYRSYIKTFRAWLQSSGVNNESYSSCVDETIAREFMNGMEQKDNISARTYNNYLKFLIGVFNWLVDKGYSCENPFIRIPKKSKRLMKKNRRLFTDEEIVRLFEFLSIENPKYLVACMLCYLCLIRPKEIALLKCRDIDPERQIVHIRSEIAKNDNDSNRTIPDDLAKLIRNTFDVRSNPDWYLFTMEHGNISGPGPYKMCSREISRYWENEVRSHCGFSMDLKFYSLKDTGITNMLGSGIPITTVQAQADHSSVAMTSVYVGRRANANESLKHLDLSKTASCNDVENN